MAFCAKRWSKLQKSLYGIVADNIDFQVHCVVYPMYSQYGRTGLPRYWIVLSRETIWDYPKQFVADAGRTVNLSGRKKWYPYTTDIPDISRLIRDYIDTPKQELLDVVFADDHWGLINILRAADRRLGRLNALRKKTRNLAARKVIGARLAASGEGFVATTGRPINKIS